jgi:protein SCO1/2
MTRVSRRGLLASLCATAFVARSRRARAHNTPGVVEPPLPAPAFPLTLQDGSATTLAAALSGRVSAVQLMFTSCQNICPIQGALFARAARQLGDSIKTAQWLSLSIDPEHDDPAALEKWMARFGAHPRWRAGRPASKDVAALIDLMKARNPGPDPHTAQIYFFNRRAELVLRSVDLPPIDEVLRVMSAIEARA